VESGVSFAQISKMRCALSFFSFLTVLLFACNNAGKTSSPKAVETESRYGLAFNQSAGLALNSYDKMVENFVNWDSLAVDKEAGNLKGLLESMPLEELKKDSASYQTAIGEMDKAKKDLASLTAKTTITDKRHSLNSLTDHLYSFLKTVKYDRSVLYLHHCPMAFNDEDSGLWLSKTDSIRNPYLGLHHPTYGKAMIECGDTKGTIDFSKGKEE
jgi:hypothetical protein